MILSLVLFIIWCIAANLNFAKPPQICEALALSTVSFATIVPPRSKHLTTDFISTDGWMLVADLIYANGSLTCMQQDQTATHPVVFVETCLVDEALPVLKQLANYILITADHFDTLSGTEAANSLTPPANAITPHPLLREPALHMWWGLNAAIVHPKLRALPLGPKWEYQHTALLHEDTHKITAEFEEALKQHAVKRSNENLKSQVLHAKFARHTTDNPRVHSHCQTRIKALDALVNAQFTTVEEVEKKIPRHSFLKSLAESRFAICPPGNGPDTHRFWEALHFDAVPVTLAYSPFDMMFQDIPMLQVSNWDELDPSFFASSRASNAEKFMRSWNKKKLSRKHWENLIRYNE